MSHSLSGQSVFVTGANRGIGAALVHALLKAGVARVYAGARKTESLPDFNDPRVVAVQIDVTDQTSVDAAAHLATDADVLINNAGTAVFSAYDSPLDALLSDFRVNVEGTLRATQAFLPAFRKRGSGTVANVISVVGLAPSTALTGYSASKAALHSLTQSLRLSTAKDGLRVVGIYPGPIDTELARDIPMTKATPESAAQAIIEGLEAGLTDIYPDPVAIHIGRVRTSAPEALETALTGE